AAATSGPMTEFQKLHLEYWTQFRSFLEDRSSTIRTGKPSKDHLSNVAVGRSNFTLVAWNGMRDSRSGVYLSMTGPDAKAHFGLLEAQYRDAINPALAPLG